MLIICLSNCTVYIKRKFLTIIFCLQTNRCEWCLVLIYKQEQKDCQSRPIVLRSTPMQVNLKLFSKKIYQYLFYCTKKRDIALNRFVSLLMLTYTVSYHLVIIVKWKPTFSSLAKLRQVLKHKSKLQPFYVLISDSFFTPYQTLSYVAMEYDTNN